MKDILIKKCISIVLALVFMLSLFNITGVFASDEIFKLTNVEIGDKSSDVTASIEGFDDDLINTNVTFYKLNSYVTYKLTIKNNSEDNYKIVTISDTNTSHTIVYDYNKHENEDLLAGSSFNLDVKGTYKNGVTDMSKRDEVSNFKLTIKLVSEDGKEEEKDIDVVTPTTGDNIVIYYILGTLSLLSLIALWVFKNKKLNKMMLLLLLLVPFVASAVTVNLIITFNNKYRLNDKVVVTVKDNNEEKEKIIDYDSKLSDVTPNTKAGYNFIGWYKDNEEFDLNNNTVKEDISLEAKYELVNYAITYNLNDGVAENPTSYNVETNDITLNNPTKEGYTFKGWTGSNGETAETTVTITKGSTGDKTYTANWDVNSYKITYEYFDDSSDKSVELPRATSHEYNSSVTVANGLTKAGYTFDGWYNGNELVANFTMPDSDVTLKGRFIPNGNTPYKVEHYLEKLEAGTFELDYTEPKTGTTGQLVTASSKAYAGFTYDATNENNHSSEILTGDGSLVLKLYYKRNSYTLTINKNNGEEAIVINGKFESPINTIADPERNGYTFTGWSSDIPTTMPSSNKTIDAQWTINDYTITYNLDNGTVSGNPNTYTVETDDITLVNPTREGYTFTGWTGSNGNTPSTAVTILKGSTGDKTYTANWEAIPYTITYNLDNGTVSGNPETYTIETDDITLNNPTKTGYTFTGWTGTDTPSATSEVIIRKGSIGNRTYTANWTRDTYSITYNLAGGTATNPTEYNVETDDITLNNPTKEGYTFTGWTGSNGNTPSTAVTITKGSTGNKDYTANWEADTYTITYNLDNGTVSGNPNSYTIESSEITLNPPTKEGYTFTGWTGSNGNTPSTTVTIATGSTGNKEYTANWEIITYTITYNLNDGTATNPESYTIETNDITLNNPTKTGYTFTGWTGSNGNTPSTAVTILKGSTGNKVYTANWSVNTHSVVYEYFDDSDVKSVTLPVTKTYDYNTVVRVEDDLALEGYTFDGWYMNNVELPKLGSFNMPDSDVTIKGRFKANENTPYRVEYYLEQLDGSYLLDEGESLTMHGTTGQSVSAKENDYEGFTLDKTNPNTVASALITGSGDLELKLYYTRNSYTITINKNNGEEQVVINGKYESAVPSQADPVKVGYTFQGWSSPIPSKMPHYDLTINAQWEINQYTITFNTDGGTTINPITQNYGTAVTAPSDPTKEGYTFAGWDQEIPTTMPAENKTITANWTINQYTLTFDTDGGSAIAPITQNYGTVITAPSNPTKEGYTFAGWDQEIPATMPAENRTIKATWTINQYTLTFDTDGGSAIAPITQNYGTAVTAPSNPTKEGYTFAGWDQEIPATMPAEDKTITANWTINEYNISYDLDGGAASNPASYNIETDTITLSNPTKNGYTFTGWTGTDLTAATTTVTIAKGSTGDKSYKANWEINTYRITYTLNGGEVATANPESYTVETDNITLNNPTKTGYTFTGWTGTDVDTASKEVIITKGSTGDRTYTANWSINSYNVTYEYFDDSADKTVELPIATSHEYNSSVTVANGLTKAGYTFDGWYNGNELVANFTMPDSDVTLKGRFIPNGNTPYKVEHYLEKLEAGTFELDYTEPKTGTTGQLVTASSNAYAGFTYDATNENNYSSAVLTGDGSLLLKLYYKRNSYQVTYSYTGTVPSSASPIPEPETHKFGETVTLASKGTAPGYTFNGWLKDNEVVTTFEMPIGDVAVTGSFAYATNTPYKIEHYGQDVNGNYVVMRTENKTGTTNANVSASQMNVDHQIYTYNPLHPDQVSSGRIKADGSLVLKMYYLRNKYDLYLINESNVDGATSGEYYYGTQLTLTAHNRDEDDEPFTKWSDGTTNKTKNITITQDMTIGPYYHVYTITLIDKDPRTTGISSQVQTQTIKVDPGQSVNLPILPPREECKYAKDSTHQSPEARECSYIAEFLGWFTTEEYTEEIESPYTAPGDVTLYAKWNAVYYHYRISEVREYSGTQGDYDDSGVILYNIDNRNRDFNINFDIIEYDVSSFAQPTIMNGKYEKQSLNYPGFVIRFIPSGADGWKKIQVTSRWKSLQIEKYMSSTNPWKAPATATEPIHIEITRRNGVVKATYTTNYSGSDGITDSGYVVNLFNQNNNPPDLPDKVATTVTFGATIDEYGIPMRFFKGKLANIDVKMASDLYDPLT